MSQGKVIPLIVAGDNHVREDVLVIVRHLSRELRADITHRLDEMQSAISALRRDVDRLKEGTSP